MLALEDNFGDIIGKAQRGLQLTDTQLAEKARVNSAQIRMLRRGQFDEMAIWRVAPVLGLSARALCEMAEGLWVPPSIDNIPGLAAFSTTYDDALVNSYLVWHKDEAIAFDTGADCSEMLKTAKQNKTAIKLILLTHAHPDHVADLPRLKSETKAPVYTSDKEPAAGAEAMKPGTEFKIGRLEVECRSTWGHSAGGVTYVVTGLKKTVAIVGDAIFAGSMGGGGVSYKDALKNNIEQILSLPDDTILCPGHGPMTTVREEEEHNPFFAARIGI